MSVQRLEEHEMEINKRRQLLAAGGLVAFSAGYSETASRVAGKLRPKGYLLIGHSESLHGISQVVRQVSPSIYRLD